MSAKILSWTLAGALVALAVIGLGGCGSNEAQDSSPGAEAGALEPEIDGPTDADPREAELAEREQALAERERAVAQAEQRAADRLDRLEASVDRLAQREDELSTREKALGEMLEPVAPVAEAEPVDLEPSTVWIALPSSTPIEVAFEDALSSETSLAGDRFRTTVLRDVWSGEQLAIPAGSTIGGFVAQATPQKKIGGQAQLVLEFDRLELPSGDEVALAARFEKVGRPQKKKDATTIGGSAAGGALLGRVLGDDSKSTAIGAILGAAVGTAVASNNAGDPVLIEPGMTTQLLLTREIELPVRSGH